MPFRKDTVYQNLLKFLLSFCSISVQNMEPFPFSIPEIRVPESLGNQNFKPHLKLTTLRSHPRNFLKLSRVSYRIFCLGGREIYWCINEARKCERRGLGESPSLFPPPPPPPQKFVEDLASLAKFDKFNAYAQSGVYLRVAEGGHSPPPPCAILAPPSLIIYGQSLFKIPLRAMSETLIYEQLEKRLS